MRLFLFYTPSMWRRHLYRYLDPSELKFDIETFGYIGNYKNSKILRTMKKLMLFEPETGKSFYLKTQDKKKYLYINNFDHIKKNLPKCYEGETIGFVEENNDFDKYPDLLYNCRVCLKWNIYIDDNCSNLIEMDRSELVTYTRQHYYQLNKYFNLPSLQYLLNCEKNYKSECIKKIWNSYFT